MISFWLYTMFMIMLSTSGKSEATPVKSELEILRNAQMVKAKVIWSTRPMAVVPLLAVTRQGEESFVYVVRKQNGMALAHRTEVTLGDTVGNNYSIASGLSAGDRVIVSATQFLVDGMPVSWI